MEKTKITIEVRGIEGCVTRHFLIPENGELSDKVRENIQDMVYQLIVPINENF